MSPCVRVRPRPAHSPRTPMAHDYEESPKPTAAASPHFSTARTHAHTHAHAQGHGPARGPCWQRWTHTQLWELRKWARAEPSLEGLVRRLCRETMENRRLQPAVGWMPQDAWEAMLADALHPQGVHARQLPTPQKHPHVLGRLRETLQATQKEGKSLWDITPSPAPHTDTPSPPRKRRRTDTGSTDTAPTRRTPGTPHATQHDALDPPGRRRRRLTPRGVTSYATPGSHANDTTCPHRPPHPAAPTPGREPIRPGGHKAPRATVARTGPSQA